MKPTKSILDQSRPYVPSHATDLRASFARIRREMKKAQSQSDADRARIALIFDTRRMAKNGN